MRQALFKRTTRQVLLTDSGQVLLQQTQYWFTQLNNQIAQLQRISSLVIEVTTYTAVRWLSPKIAAYRQSYPDQPITLQHSVKQAPNSNTQADVSVLWQHEGDPVDFLLLHPYFLWPIPY